MKRFILILLWILVISSSSYLLMLGWFNMPSLDDYGYIAMTEHHGLWGLIKISYLTWQCRFSTFFLNGIIFIVFGRAQNLIGVTILLLLMGWFSVERLLSGVLWYYKLFIPYSIILPIAVLATNIGIMSFLEPSTFYWLCALNYSFEIWFTILLVYFIFYSNSSDWIRWAGSIVCLLYISGSAENYTPLVILVLGFVFIIRLFRQHTWKWWTDKTNNMLFVSLIILSTGFLVMILGPGNRVRMESGGGEHGLIGKFSFALYILKISKASAILMLRFVSRSYYYLILAPIFVWLGNNCYADNTTELSTFTWKHVLSIVVLFVVFFVTSVGECVYGLGWYAPPRAFCFMSFVLLGVWVYVAFRFGMYNKNNITISYITVGAIIAAIVLFAFSFVRDFPIAESYHSYVTERNNEIKLRTEQERTDVYICKPFNHKWQPTTYSSMRNCISELLGKERRFYEPQVLLMVSELSDNPEDWRNKGLQSYYSADFDIICLKNNSNESKTKKDMEK